MDEQLLKDYHILLTVWPFVEHMYLIEKDSDRQLYISFVNGLYSVLENLICEFYSILVNRNGVIPPLETPSIVPEAYKEMSAASRHLYHYLVARDMQHIVSLLDNRYRDMWFIKNDFNAHWKYVITKTTSSVLIGLWHYLWELFQIKFCIYSYIRFFFYLSTQNQHISCTN